MSSASSRTSVVVCADPGYRTGKLEAARRHGTAVISEDEFLRLLASVAPGTDKSAAPSRAASPRPTPTSAASRTPSSQAGAQPPSAPPRLGPLAGHRVLVLGGPHAEATAVRARVASAGGQVAVNFTASVTDMVVLAGADADPRWHRGSAAGLRTLLPDTLLPQAPVPPVGRDSSARGAGHDEVEPGEGGPVPDSIGLVVSSGAVVLPRGGVVDLPSGTDWSLSVRWTDRVALEPANVTDLANVAEVDVVAFLTDDGEEVGGDDDFVFFNSPTHPSGSVVLELGVPGETLVNVRPELIPAETRRVVVAAVVADGRAFGDVGPIELTLRDGVGATVARATLDAATEELSLILAVLYQRGDWWRFRAVGQGYLTGLASLAVRHGVDVDED